MVMKSSLLCNQTTKYRPRVNFPSKQHHWYELACPEFTQEPGILLSCILHSEEVSGRLIELMGTTCWSALTTGFVGVTPCPPFLLRYSSGHVPSLDCAQGFLREKDAAVVPSYILGSLCFKSLSKFLQYSYITQFFVPFIQFSFSPVHVIILLLPSVPIHYLVDYLKCTDIGIVPRENGTKPTLLRHEQGTSGLQRSLRGNDLHKTGRLMKIGN